ncbi:hypothetical protein ACDF64_03175 [Agromyces sp. MMS24-JH15]|uniref:hypothetical protein n=1 Tax=Agromyces sp. MMS24-JH15 TaxID=3243765 RepID=UPI00374795A0
MMDHLREKLAVALAVGALTIAAQAGCAPSAPTGGTTDDTGETQQETTEPEPAPDLTGEWVQQNSNSPDSFQQATITADTIEVFWVSDGGATTALYWSGTFVAPTEAGDYSWDSANDTTKTSSALLASSDPTKTFTYSGDIISYPLTAMGVTMTVELARK